MVTHRGADSRRRRLDRSVVVTTFRSWWSWLLQPWRSPASALALVGSFALPAVVLAASGMYEQSAADSIAAVSAAQLDADAAGFTINAQGYLNQDGYGPMDRVIQERYRAIASLGPVERVLITDDVPVAEALADGAAATGTGRNQGRLFARDGAIDALEVVAGDRGRPGAWISQRLAERLGVSAGDLLTVGTPEPVMIAGVYRDLWADDGDPYWDSVPSLYVPRFQSVFNAPDFELIIVPEAMLIDIGPLGRAEWHANLADTPRTYDGLAGLAVAYLELDRSFRDDPAVAEPYRAFAADPEIVPFTSSTAYGALVRARDVRGGLQQPLRTATVGGTVAGMLLSSLGAIFLLRRRSHEYRLMAADGDGPVRFLGRAVPQFLVPAAAGAVVGLAAAWVLVVGIGPSGRADLAAVDVSTIVLASATAVVLAAAITAGSAVRLVDGLNVEVGELGRSWLVFLIGAAGAMWVQVGREQATDAGPLVVAFPFVGILTGVLTAVVLLRLLLRAVRRSGHGLPTPLFLAWRAMTASDTAALMVMTALGLATGLAVLSSLFVTSIDTASEAKAITKSGSATRVTVSGQLTGADLPPSSTVVRTTTTPVGDQQVTIVAVDPDTFGELSWPSSFGHDASWLIERLVDQGDRFVPAVSVGGRTLPESGEYGLFRRFPYQIVGTIDAVPLASDRRPTLVVRADVFEAFAQRRWDSGREGPDEVEAEVAAATGDELSYQSPLFGYRSEVLSSAAPDEVVTAVEATGARPTETTTLNEQLSTLEVRATRWVFEFLRILAAIGAVAAVGALALYLAERRRDREVANVLTRQMGIRPWVSKVATSVELVGLVVIALGAGSTAATVTAGRVFPRFEPEPSVPPVVGLNADVNTIAAVMLLVVLAVVSTALLTERAADRAVRARVMQDRG